MLNLNQKKFIADRFYEKVGKAIPYMDIQDDGKIKYFQDKTKTGSNFNLRLCVYPFTNSLYFWGEDMADAENTKFEFKEEKRELTADEKAEMSKAIREDKKRKEQEEKAQQEALKFMEKQFNALPLYDSLNSSSLHPYLKKKGLLHSYICHYDSDKDELCWALRGPRGEFRGVQRITQFGEKKLITGTRMRGSFTSLYDSKLSTDETIFAVEGLATGISVFEATGHKNIVLICVNAGNLSEALKSAIQYYIYIWRLKITPEQFAKRIVIIADNDKSGAGENEARKASQETGCSFLVVPNFGDETITDANDIHVKKGINTLSSLLRGDYLISDSNNYEEHSSLSDEARQKEEQPQNSREKTHEEITSPIKREVVEPEEIHEDHSNLFYTDLRELKAQATKWILEGCVQMDNCVNLLIAFENTGKSFISIDWCLTYVTGATSWHGKKITSVSKERRIVYLFSESNISSLMVRIDGWLQENNKRREDINGKFILLNLKELFNVAEGDIKLTKKTLGILTKALQALGYETIDLFVIDTLNGFEEGDENSNSDCANFLNNVIGLMSAFNGNSLILHHAGTASIGKPIEEIRPRGASALAGRVDNITTALGSITKGLELYNRKNRDTGKDRFFIRGKVITVESAEPDCTGAKPTTIVFTDTPSMEIQADVEKEKKEVQDAKNFEKNEKLSPKTNEVYEVIKNGLKSGALKATREPRGDFSFMRSDLKEYLINLGYSKNEACHFIGNYQNRKSAGLLIAIGMLSSNENDESVKTSQVRYTTHDNPLYSYSVGTWDFKTDEEIERELSTKNVNSTE